MSRTKHTFRNGEFPAKTKRKLNDRKFFGFTDGVHSSFVAKSSDSDENIYLQEVSDFVKVPIKKNENNRTYALPGIDYVKYGYGNGTKKENRTKNYKREIE